MQLTLCWFITDLWLKYKHFYFNFLYSGYPGFFFYRKIMILKGNKPGTKAAWRGMDDIFSNSASTSSSSSWVGWLKSNEAEWLLIMWKTLGGGGVHGFLLGLKNHIYGNARYLHMQCAMIWLATFFSLCETAHWYKPTYLDIFNLLYMRYKFLNYWTTSAKILILIY